ncbi:MAG: hypothetical protein AAF869_00335 [Pseudomonadota bacterium]
MPNRYIAILGLAVWWLTASPGFAQNTGGIFGPVVAKGHAAFQYRITSRPKQDSLAQRLHYEQAPTDALMWRIVGQARTSDADGTEFDYVQGELFWDLTEDQRLWQSGLRFDGRVRGQGRPGVFALNWTNQWRLSDRLELRGIALSSVEIGDDRQSGVFLETRAHLAYDLQPGLRFGVESFNAYGTTSGFEPFARQRHQVGPFLNAPVVGDWSVFLGALAGASEASPDLDLRFWLTRVL